MTTKHLGFRLWSPSDLPLADALWGDPKVTALIGGPFDAQQVQTRLHAEIAGMDAHNVQYWPIFLLPGDEHVGCAGLRPYSLALRHFREDDRIYEIGFHLRPPYWGRGLAEEAAHAVIAIAFETLRAKAIFAGHHPLNVASRRLLAKLGFRHTHDELYPPTGLNHPSYLLQAPPYSLSA
jgi:ribosomal-protein-alanine N-acetyltransferase